MSPAQEKENESAFANKQMIPPLLTTLAGVGWRGGVVLTVPPVLRPQPASPEPSSPNWERDRACPARPTATAAPGEPASAPARGASTGPTATPPSPSAPVSHRRVGGKERRKKDEAFG